MFRFPLGCWAANKLVVAGQSTTVAVTVVSFISVPPVRETKRGAVGAAPLLIVPAESAAASSSAFAADVQARASTEYRVDVFIVLLVLRCLFLLFIDLEDGLVASLALGGGPQF